MNRANDLLTVPAAAEEKGVHLKSMYRAIAGNRVKHERQGATILIRRKDLEAWKPRQSRRIGESTTR